MLFNKLGDRLKFALKTELGTTKDPRFFNSALMCLALTGTIKNETAIKLKEWARDNTGLKLWREHNLAWSVEEDELIKEFIEELSYTFVGRNLNELLVQLNALEVEPFMSESELWDVMPDLYLINNKLYGIVSYYGNTCLTSINPEKARYIKYGLKNYSEILSYDYEHIIGCNRKEGKLYLQGKTKYLCAEYFIDTKQEVIYHAHLEGMVDDCPVVYQNNALCTIQDGCVKTFKELSYKDKYIVEDRVIIEPNVELDAFYKPYLIETDGYKDDFDYQSQASFLWSLVLYDVMGPDYYSYEKRFDYRNEATFHFCLEHIKKSMEEDFYGEIECKLSKYQRLIKVLEHYFNPNENILDIAYKITEIALRFRNEFCEEGTLITCEFVEKLEELDRSEKLKDILFDSNKLGEALTEDLEIDNDKIVNIIDYEIGLGGHIGCFNLNSKFEDVSESEWADLDEAENNGNQLVLNKDKRGDKDWFGEVTYNPGTQEYIIKSERLMTKNEIDNVMYKFKLINESVRVLVDSNDIKEKSNEC